MKAKTAEKPILTKTPTEKKKKKKHTGGVLVIKANLPTPAPEVTRDPNMKSSFSFKPIDKSPTSLNNTENNAPGKKANEPKTIT